MRRGCYLIDVPLIESDPKVVRVNVTMERGVLKAVDATAKTFGMSRSAFLSEAAQSRIERSDRPLRVTATGQSMGSMPAVRKPLAAKAVAKSAGATAASTHELRPGQKRKSQ